ncbi:MAG: hypothetical protein E7222_12525 [Clostridiales bacterium]|nr:hypothetical protein [Clostridiales bacterium]
MNILKKLTALGLTVVITAGLAACGGGGSSAKDVMKTAQDKLKDVKSLSYDMVMDMDFSAGEQTIESDTTAKIDYTTDPLAMKINMAMDMGAQGSADITMYAEKLDDKYMMYMTMDGVNWAKQTLGDASELEQYNAQNSMELYLNGIENFKEAGTEKINGSDATRYDGVISQDAMGDVMASSGAADKFTQYGLTETQIEELYKDLGDLPASVWIDNESSLPVKYEMDMTGVMQQMFTKVVESSNQNLPSDFKVDKMFITMTLTNFNNVDKITVPDAARNGQEAAF